MKKKIPISKTKPGPVIPSDFFPSFISAKHIAARRSPIPQPILPAISKKRRPSLSEVKADTIVKPKLKSITIMVSVLAVCSLACCANIVWE